MSDCPYYLHQFPKGQIVTIELNGTAFEVMRKVEPRKGLHHNTYYSRPAGSAYSRDDVWPWQNTSLKAMTGRLRRYIEGERRNV